MATITVAAPKPQAPHPPVSTSAPTRAARPALPRPEDCAKDLGVFNIANAMPQSLAPLLGAALLAVGAGANYNLMYLTAAALTFLGALAIIPVRKVR